ncbi:MAG: phosphoribosyltransferase family protein, partial [Pseudomonadota bacterium]
MPHLRGHYVRILFNEEEIAERNRELAEDIAAKGYRELLAVIVLKGAFVFAADLVRALHLAGVTVTVECMSLSSYGASEQSSGEVRVIRDIQEDVTGRDILLIDDILESGRTLAYAQKLLLERGANRVDCAVLLQKPSRRVEKFEAAFTGFECPDVFVVG